MENYKFNIISYILLSLITMFFYYNLISTSQNISYLKLFVLLPLLGSALYVVAYLKDYFNNFSEDC